MRSTTMLHAISVSDEERYEVGEDGVTKIERYEQRDRFGAPLEFRVTVYRGESAFATFYHIVGEYYAPRHSTFPPMYRNAGHNP
jgi:hypothetical protein